MFTPLLMVVAFFFGVIAFAAQQPVALIGVGGCVIAFIAMLVGYRRTRQGSAAADEGR